MIVAITIEGALRHRKLYIGKHVRLHCDGTEQECRAKVVEIQQGTMLLELFAGDNDALKLLPQEQLTVVFVVPDDAAYSLSAKIINYVEPARLLRLTQEAPLTRTEKRSDYRLRTAKLIYVALCKQSGDGGEVWQQASLLDISRSGASVLTVLPVSQNDELKVWIPLEEVDHILEAGTRVVRVSTGEAEQLILGLSFSELSLTDQEKILDYILKEWGEGK